MGWSNGNPWRMPRFRLRTTDVAALLAALHMSVPLARPETYALDG